VHPDEARQMLEELQAHCLKRAMPPEIQRLGRTIKQWFDKLCNHHLAWVTNGPTESLNKLIKLIKRVGFGFRNFKNYRIRPCSTPAGPTGECWARSSFDEALHPARIRRAALLAVATEFEPVSPPLRGRTGPSVQVLPVSLCLLTTASQSG
jgi:Transposase